jgi:hypothetical protein
MSPIHGAQSILKYGEKLGVCGNFKQDWIVYCWKSDIGGVKWQRRKCIEHCTERSLGRDWMSIFIGKWETNILGYCLCMLKSLSNMMN